MQNAALKSIYTGQALERLDQTFKLKVSITIYSSISGLILRFKKYLCRYVILYGISLI